MSRLIALTLAGVSALALSTVTAPVAQPAAEFSAGSSSTVTHTAGGSTQRVGGGWCC